MKTYQDLIACGESLKDRGTFITEAVAEHKNSEEYRVAADAEEYYAKRNVTIRKFQQYIYDVTGRKRKDAFSTDHRLRTGFFNRFVTQQLQYVLSNGVTFAKDDTKKKLGADFDNVLQEVVRRAMVCGKSFAFWNRDHLQAFNLVQTDKTPGFAPLYDEETGALRAGIRFWSTETVDRYTLYEADGYTEYIKRKDEPMQEKEPKRAYITTSVRTQAGGVESVTGENYPGFPIITVYANDLHQSELVGIRESIDCYDFIKSGLANEVDTAAGFYWTVTGADGMDDADLQRFVERMKVVRAATLGEGATATAHTLDIPTEAHEKLLERLRNDMYEDFMLLDTEKALGGNLTATAIRLAYQPQDDKCGGFEYCIRSFITQLLELVEIRDEPSFKWNRIANQTEETQMVLTAANYLDEQTVLDHLPWLTPEEVEEIMKRRSAEAVNRFGGTAADEGVTEDETA